MDGNTLTILIAVGQAVITGVSALFGWLLKGLFDSIAELKAADAKLAEEVVQLRVTLPERYVSKQDFQQMGDAIFSALRRIEDKLDGKADKK